MARPIPRFAPVTSAVRFIEILSRNSFQSSPAYCRPARRCRSCSYSPGRWRRLQIVLSKCSFLHRCYFESLLLAILLVADFFHPLDRLAVEFFLDGDVRHRSGGGCAVPVLFVG